MKILVMGLIPVAAAMLVAAGPAAAQSIPPAPSAPAVLRSVSGCRAIADAQARLACFDAAVARLDDAVKARDITVLDRDGVQKTRRSLFGFTIPRIELFGGPSDPEEPEFAEINTTVRRAIPVGFGKYELVLEDGARWVTSEALGLPPRDGVAVRIRKATLGAFFIAVGKQRTVRGRRIG